MEPVNSQPARHWSTLVVFILSFVSFFYAFVGTLGGLITGKYIDFILPSFIFSIGLPMVVVGIRLVVEYRKTGQ